MTSLSARLVEAVPELKAFLDEHVEIHREVLPHVFFGDETRFVQTALSRGNHGPVSRVLDVLEGAVTSPDADVRNDRGVVSGKLGA